MKKVLCLLLVLIISVGFMSVSVFAETKNADIYVTISDNTGKVVLAQEKISVADRNGDGKFNIDEALYAAHSAKYNGGADTGYSTATGDWGLYITKLWGDVSGNFGYYVNNQMSMGLGDEVKAGDYLNAYIYQVYEFDPITYETTADSYCFFDKFSTDVTKGDSITVTLNAVEFDEYYSPVNVPVADAVITIDGADTTYNTDAQGKVTIPINKEGNLIISAKKVDTVLVPPVLKVNSVAKTEATNDNKSNASTTTVSSTDNSSKSPKTGDEINIFVYLSIIVGLSGLILTAKCYEK